MPLIAVFPIHLAGGFPCFPRDGRRFIYARHRRGSILVLNGR